MGRLSTKAHKWTKTEDEALISALRELCQSGWKRDNNIFKSGYTTVLEKELKSKLPGCNLKASPHILSRLKTLKKRCDVKGSSNKPFPYYDELCLIFGRDRGNHRVVEDASDANRAVEIFETSDYAGHMSTHEQFKVSENGNHGFDDAEANGHKVDDVVVDDDSNDVWVDEGTNADNKKGQEFDHEEVNGHKADDVVANDDSNDDDDVSVDEGTNVANKKGQSSNWSSATEGLVKIIEALIKKQDEQFSVLVGMVGLDVAADKAAADKRIKLNEELKKIPNLSLQARLRAASIVVGDSAKLDLFYSLSDEERQEWVSMLLSGLL